MLSFLREWGTCISDKAEKLFSDGISVDKPGKSFYNVFGEILHVEKSRSEENDNRYTCPL